jgi:tripartite-type tricarboxylate transporter receptor subunit TctC
MLKILLAAFTAIAALTVTVGPAAAVYPDKLIRIVVPFTPAGPTDILARIVADGLNTRLGVPVIVDYRPGANANLGTDVVAKAAPDGYTLLLGYIGPLAINPTLYGKLPFNPLEDFTPIGLLAASPLVVVVHPSFPATSMGDLVRQAKAASKPLAYASPGNGSAPHMATELFRLVAGVDMVHIPYKGLAPAVMDVVAGQVPIIFGGPAVTLPQIRAGKLRALAVTTRERSLALPDVPTMQEAGFKDFDVSAWFGLLAPAKLPAPILERLEKTTQEIMRTKEAISRLETLGMVANPDTSKEFAEFIRRENQVWAKVVKASGAKAE